VPQRAQAAAFLESENETVAGVPVCKYRKS